MGLNKSPILSYNRSVIYVVPVKTGKFLHGGGGHWFPFGGPKSDFLFHKLERRPLCTLLYAAKAYLFFKTHSIPLWFVPWIFPWPLQLMISCCSKLTARTLLSTMESGNIGRKQIAIFPEQGNWGTHKWMNWESLKCQTLPNGQKFRVAFLRGDKNWFKQKMCSHG